MKEMINFILPLWQSLKEVFYSFLLPSLLLTFLSLLLMGLSILWVEERNRRWEIYIREIDPWLFQRASFLGYWPHFYQWFPLFLILWITPIFLVSRSFYMRNHYLPQEWYPSSLSLPSLPLEYFPNHSYLFILPLIFPILCFLFYLRGRISEFFLELKTYYYWLLIRLWAIKPLAKIFDFLCKMEKDSLDNLFILFEYSREKNFHFLVVYLLHLHRLIHNPQYALKIWVSLIPLDILFHGGKIHWCLGFLPFWAIFVLLWRSLAFLYVGGTHGKYWNILFYKNPLLWKEEDYRRLVIFSALIPPSLHRRFTLMLLRRHRIYQRNKDALDK